MAEGVQIDFGGKTRTLRYKPSTIREFETRTDKTLVEELPRKGFGTLTILLALGFKAEDPDFNFPKVEAALDRYVDEGGDLNDVWDAVSKAMLKAGLFGNREKGKAEGAPLTA